MRGRLADIPKPVPVISAAAAGGLAAALAVWALRRSRR